MPFDLSEEQLEMTEKELGVKLPAEYRLAMMDANGGDAETEEDNWQLYPIKDTSDRKRISRTCNHILQETKSYKEWERFPQNSIVIASNGCGDQMIFIQKHGQFLDAVFLWLHETGEVQVLAKSFNKINKY